MSLDLAYILLAARVQPDPAPSIAMAARLGATVDLAVIAAPHPGAAHARFGPTSADPGAARTAAAHLVVAVHGLAGSLRERDGGLARVTAAVLADVPAIGVIFGHGTVFHDPDAFCVAVVAAPDRLLPTALAAELTMAREACGCVSFLSHGLSRYGRDEVLVFAPPARMADGADFALVTAGWLLDEPAPRFATGDTVGRSADERIVVVRVPHPTRRDAAVLRLEL